MQPFATIERGFGRRLVNSKKKKIMNDAVLDDKFYKVVVDFCGRKNRPQKMATDLTASKIYPGCVTQKFPAQICG